MTVEFYASYAFRCKEIDVERYGGRRGFPDSDYFEEHDGGVYFVQGIDGGPIKIGWSRRHPNEGRLADLQRGSPIRLVVLGYILGASVRLENAFHHEFAESRLHGEWFEPTDDLLDLIRKWSWET